MNVVAIHQPNFFPWLGYFDKIARADLFLLMDNVQLPRHSSVVNRVRILVNGEPKWATMPIMRTRGQLSRIADVDMDSSQPWRAKLVRTIQQSYARSRYFEELFPLIGDLVEYPHTAVADYNTHAIRAIAKLLGLQTPLLLGSGVGGEGQATELLISMVQRVGGRSYLHGAGAANYQRDELFEAAGIRLVSQDFEHPLYNQQTTGACVIGLSIIDVLMNWGVDATQRFLAESKAAAAALAAAEGSGDHG